MKLNRKRKGFTLVEIMIVVAIIALLATIAVPNFLRVRKRSQATRILEEMRLIEGAKDQWAIEKNQMGAAEPTAKDLAVYVKAGSDLQKKLNDGGDAKTVKDLIDQDITIGKVDEAPKISQNTFDEFTTHTPENATDPKEGVVEPEFWGAYAPGAEDTTDPTP